MLFAVLSSVPSRSSSSPTSTPEVLEVVRLASTSPGSCCVHAIAAKIDAEESVEWSEFDRTALPVEVLPRIWTPPAVVRDHVAVIGVRPRSCSDALS